MEKSDVCYKAEKRVATYPDDGPSPGLLNEINRFLSFSSVKRYVSLGNEIVGAVAPFLDKPTWWNGVKAGFNACKVFVDDVEAWPEDYFQSNDWVQPYSNDFSQTLTNVLYKLPYERIKTDEESTHIRVCRLPNGVKCGWIYVSKKRGAEKVYMEAKRLEEGKDCIKRMLWEQFNGRSLVMRRNSRWLNRESTVIFEPDDTFPALLSKRAVDYAAYLARPLAEGVPRSVMFYGPPGTGKSTVAMTVVSILKMRSFRIRIGDLNDLDPTTLFEAINAFEPEAVILDDFDRAQRQAELLETLEQFQRKVNLVIVTVNDRRRLDAALLRPERIDEWCIIDKMDEEVVRRVLGPYGDGFEAVKDWPVVYISEYTKRRRYMSSEEAAASVEELAMRIREVRDGRTVEDVDKMTPQMKRQVSSFRQPDEECDVPLPVDEED